MRVPPSRACAISEYAPTLSAPLDVAKYGSQSQTAGCDYGLRATDGPPRDIRSLEEYIIFPFPLRVPQTAGCDYGLRAADGPPREIRIRPGSDCGLRLRAAGCGWPSRQRLVVLSIRLRATDTGCGLRMGVYKGARSLLSTYSRRCEATDLDCGLRQSQATEKSCRVCLLL